MWLEEVALVARPETVGAFLALLGNSNEIKSVAQKLLGHRYTVDHWRSLVDWESLCEAELNQVADIDWQAFPDFNHRDLLVKLCQLRQTPEVIHGLLSEQITRWVTSGQYPEEVKCWRSLHFIDRDYPRIATVLCFWEQTRQAIADAMDRVDVCIGLAPARSTIRVTNLVGGTFVAELAEDFKHLLVGDPRIQFHPDGHRTCAITLRHIRTDYCLERDLRSLFFATAQLILSKLFWRNPQNLQDLWKDLGQSEQTDLTIAQSLILENAFFYLTQLNDNGLVKVKQLSARWSEARWGLAAAEHGLVLTGNKTQRNGDIQEAKVKIDALKRELKQSFERDDEFQQETLLAVRSKVEDNQYKLSSIPFEIFQNADDAVVELLGDVDADSGRDVFVMQWDDRRIKMMHWGRPINQVWLPNTSLKDAYAHGYHRDLEKMLVLSCSDKAEDNRTTGKFGLGFKSVFLFCDRPVIASGEYAFAVLGGMFPKRLDSGWVSQLANELSSQNPSATRGTLIELTASRNRCSRNVVERFIELAPIQVIFSQKIKRCIFRSNRNEVEVAWREHAVGGSSKAVTGKLFSTQVNNLPGGRVLVLRGTDGALLFKVDPNGFSKLDANVPTFWVTAPTDDLLNIGFAVNGKFGLDVGRAQIACGSKESIMMAEALRRDAGTALVDLWDASESWTAFSQELDLAVDTDQYAFWKSFWDLVTTSDLYIASEGPGVVRLLREILWSDSGGVSQLLRERRALPTDLPDSYRQLIALPDRLYAAQGVILDRALFRCITEADLLPYNLKAGQLVSGTIASALRKLLQSPPEIVTVTLLDVLQRAIPNSSDVTPELAARLGSIVNQELERRVKRDPHSSREFEGCIEMLKAAKFLANDGAFRPAKELLLISEGGDESLRAAFAPESKVLDENYDGLALEFFKICRQEMRAPVESLVSWGLACGNEKTKKAFVFYMIRGDHSGDVRRAIRARIEHTWLANLHLQDDYLRQFPSHEQLSLLAELELITTADLNRKPQPPVPPGRFLADPARVLALIHEWWMKERSNRLAEYDQLVYPDGVRPADTLSRSDNGANQNEAWISLILRGSFETMGRYRAEQHRRFIEICNEHAWLTELAKARPSDSRLVEMIETYLDQQIQDIPYYQWVKQFVPLFLISRWLEDYIQCFKDAETYEQHTTIKTLLSSRTNWKYSRGGPNAPPLDPILGIGAHFVLRELVRHGILRNTTLYPLCYVPNKRVRVVLSSIGCDDLESLSREDQSREIHSFLVTHLDSDKATFGYSFDIPFQIISKHTELQEELLGECPEVSEDDEEEV